MKWFGKSWNPGLCIPENHVDTPVGEKCIKCAYSIREEDQGIIIFCAKSVDTEHELCEIEPEAWHLDCFLRSILPPSFHPTRSKTAN